jgi:hypothetical protein
MLGNGVLAFRCSDLDVEKKVLPSCCANYIKQKNRAGTSVPAVISALAEAFLKA